MQHVAHVLNDRMQGACLLNVGCYLAPTLALAFLIPADIGCKPAGAPDHVVNSCSHASVPAVVPAGRLQAVLRSHRRQPMRLHRADPVP